MAELFADARRQVPLWLDAVAGRPDWDEIFQGFHSTVDYPSASYGRELAAHYPQAKVLLTVRDADSWFESVSETIFSDDMQAHLVGTPTGDMLQGTIFDHFHGCDIRDRVFMTQWFEDRTAAIVDALPEERLLVFHPKQGWEPLCQFLNVPVPPERFPRVDSRDEITAANEQEGGMAKDEDAAESFGRSYIETLRAKAFAA